MTENLKLVNFCPVFLDHYKYKKKNQ